MTSNHVTWAPAPTAGPGGWPPPAQSSLSPASLLRWVAGALAAVAGALVAGGTFPPLFVWEAGGSMSTLSGWGWEGEGEGPERQMLLGVPLVLVAAALMVAAALILASEPRPGLRPRALTMTVGAVCATTAVCWTVGSYASDFVDLYREFDIDVFSVSRGAGYWLVLAGMVQGLLALACLLLAESAGSRQRPQVPYTTAPSAPPAPSGWPAAGSPHGAAVPSAWGETR